MSISALECNQENLQDNKNIPNEVNKYSKFSIIYWTQTVITLRNGIPTELNQ